MPRQSCWLWIGLSLWIANLAVAQSVVDRGEPLKVVRAEFELADGAAWDGRSALYVPDVKAETLSVYLPNQNKWRVRLPMAGRISATFYQHGQLYLSDNANQQILVLAQRGKPQVLATFAQGERPNDLVVDNQGGIYVTLTRQGEVRYVATDGSQKTVARDLITPNGIILSPDGQTLYVSQYTARDVVAFQIEEAGKLGQQHRFASMTGLEEGAKGADGMTVDRAGNVYCSGPDGVWIWDPAGQLLDRIATPSKAINCTFGGDGRSLYISTMDNGLMEQRMFAYGREPHPPAVASDSTDSQNRPSTAIPKNITADLDVVYGQTGTRKLLADIFVPAGDAVKPAVVVVHGGGWLKGDKTKFRAMAIQLAERGYVTAAIEYRLGYEAKFPAGMQDCNAAVRFLRANAARYHIDPKRIGAVGGSAGGHLVGLMAAAGERPELQGDAGNADQSAAIQAAVVLAGPLQMASGSVADRSRQGAANSNSNAWLGKTIDEAPQLYQLADAFEQISKQTPPMLFLVGEEDTPQRNAPARQKLKELGVAHDLKIYPDLKHGAWNQLPWIETYVADIDAFLSKQLNK